MYTVNGHHRERRRSKRRADALFAPWLDLLRLVEPLLLFPVEPSALSPVSPFPLSSALALLRLVEPPLLSVVSPQQLPMLLMLLN